MRTLNHFQLHQLERFFDKVCDMHDSIEMLEAEGHPGLAEGERKELDDQIEILEFQGIEIGWMEAIVHQFFPDP